MQKSKGRLTARLDTKTDWPIARVSRLEMLDEVEELDLMLSHYVISWAVKPPSGNEETWTSWGLQKSV